MERVGNTSLIRLTVTVASAKDNIGETKEIAIKANHIEQVTSDSDGFADLLMEDGSTLKTEEDFEEILNVLKTIPGL